MERGNHTHRQLRAFESHVYFHEIDLEYEVEWLISVYFTNRFQHLIATVVIYPRKYRSQQNTTVDETKRNSETEPFWVSSHKGIHMKIFKWIFRCKNCKHNQLGLSMQFLHLKTQWCFLVERSEFWTSVANSNAVLFDALFFVASHSALAFCTYGFSIFASKLPYWIRDIHFSSTNTTSSISPSLNSHCSCCLFEATGRPCSGKSSRPFSCVRTIAICTFQEWEMVSEIELLLQNLKPRLHSQKQQFLATISDWSAVPFQYRFLMETYVWLAFLFLGYEGGQVWTNYCLSARGFSLIFLSFFFEQTVH